VIYLAFDRLAKRISRKSESAALHGPLVDQPT
jgi:hypothetical protein